MQLILFACLIKCILNFIFPYAQYLLYRDKSASLGAVLFIDVVLVFLVFTVHSSGFEILQFSPKFYVPSMLLASYLHLFVFDAILFQRSKDS